VRPARLAALILVLTAAGCDSSEPPQPDEPTGVRSYEGRVIRGWLLALDRQDYTQAAYYFAPNALIDQGRPYRLRTAEAAVEFNALLPCRADLARLVDEGGTVLATFTLREGPGGPCTGLVKVRYTIREGKFTEWRQLPESRPLPAPPRSSAALPGGCRGGAAPLARAGSRPAYRAPAGAPRSGCPHRRARPS
jgi:hypothetical protein